MKIKKNLQISEQTVKKLWEKANAETMVILSDTFGAEFFEEDTYKSLTTLESCCKKLHYDHLKVKAFLNTLDENTAAFEVLKIVAKAVNPKNWKPDFMPKNTQKKWCNVFKIDSSGFVFLTSHYFYSLTNTHSGARFFFADEKRAEFVATHFIDFYKKFLMHVEQEEKTNAYRKNNKK